MKIEIDSRELAAILAGLRMLQDQRYEEEHDSAPNVLAPGIDDIVTNGGEFEMLGSGEIDALCERINFGQTFDGSNAED